MEDIYQSIQDIISTKLSGEEAESAEERMAIIIHKLQFIPEAQRPKVTYVRETDPFLFVQEDYIDQAIRLAGGVPQTDPAHPDFAPELLLILSDTSMGTLLGELPATLNRGFWPETGAIKNNNVFIVYHPEYLRPKGLYPADDVEILAEIINPGYFVYGRNEDAWLQFDLG